MAPPLIRKSAKDRSTEGRSPREFDMEDSSSRTKSWVGEFGFQNPRVQMSTPHVQRVAMANACEQITSSKVCQFPIHDGTSVSLGLILPKWGNWNETTITWVGRCGVTWSLCLTPLEFQLGLNFSAFYINTLYTSYFNVTFNEKETSLISSNSPWFPVSVPNPSPKLKCSTYDGKLASQALKHC